MGRGRTTTLHYEYVVNDHVIFVYDIDRTNRLVKRIRLPPIVGSHGVVANPATGLLYVSYRASSAGRGTGSLLAYDLRRARVVWKRDYTTGIDSMAITPDGRTIYMPDGEGSSSHLGRVVCQSTRPVTRFPSPVPPRRDTVNNGTRD